jgi:hypothetical protein
MSQTTLYVECNDCRSDNFVTVNDAGELVQNVWPSRSTEDREIIIGARANNAFGIQHHLCPPCWIKIFGEDDNE